MSGEVSVVRRDPAALEGEDGSRSLRAPILPFPPGVQRAPGGKSASLELPALDVAPSAAELPSRAVAAFCVLLFRHSAQRVFDLVWRESTSDGWDSRVVAVDVDGATTAREFETLLRASSTSVSPGQLADLPSVVFSFVQDGSAVPLPPAAELGVAKDLHLCCVVSTDRVSYVAHFEASKLTERAVEEIGRQHRVLMQAFHRAPEEPLGQLPLQDADDRARVLGLTRGGSVPQAPLVAEEFERRAAEDPDRVAVSIGERHLTYGALDRRANQLARYLRARGVGRGQAVAVCMEPSFDFIVGVLAIFKAGGIYLPLDPSSPPERWHAFLEGIPPVVTLSRSTRRAAVEPHLPRLVYLDELEHELDVIPGDNPRHEVSAEDVTYVVYTSGTTGRPKGVLVTYGNLAHEVDVARRAYAYGEEDVVPAIARFTFSISFFELFCPLASGSRLLLLDRSDVVDMARMVSVLERVTCVHIAPSLWRNLLAYIDGHGVSHGAFARVRHVSSGGDMVPPDVLEGFKRVFMNADVFVIYGCSEMVCMGLAFQAPRDRTIRSTRVGRPFPNVFVRVLDERGQPTPPGVVGEVYFGGAGVAQGYLNSPELTAMKFVSFEGERIYRTGDLGRIDEEGEVELIGRCDFQIQLRGLRIEPAEVEANLRLLPDVRDAVVAAPVMPDGEKRLVAYVVPQAGRNLTRRALREYLMARLPDYMVPASFVILKAIPVNANGKVDRLALAKPTGALLSPEVGARPPTNARERRMAAVWDRVLGVRGIGLDDDFFDTGGDSLRAVSLMAAIEEEFGVALPIDTLLTRPTVAGVLEATSGEASTDPVVCLRRGDDSRSPVFLVHDGEGETIPYRNLALRLDARRSVYGLPPKRDRGRSILHTRFDEMVGDFVRRIRQIQTHGPYIVGGMCIGGFIAFEVARRLCECGEFVGPVLLFDAAHVTATRRPLAKERLGRLHRALEETRGQSPWSRASAVSWKLLSGFANVVGFEVRSEVERRLSSLRVRVSRFFLDRGRLPPALVADAGVTATLRFAEKEYVVPAPYPGKVVLFRATVADPELSKLLDDRPHAQLFEDSELGWRDKVRSLSVVDVPAGHSSMLREPAVASVARLVQEYIDQIREPVSEPEPEVTASAP